MICVYCFHTKTSVTNSRGHAKEPATWRRHHCDRCNKTFSTFERPAMADIYRITDETHGSDAPYSRSHLSASLVRAFGHLAADTRYETLDWLVETVEKRIVASAYYGALSKEELAMTIHDVLTHYDAVAGVQYAAQNGLMGAVNQKRRGRPSLR